MKNPINIILPILIVFLLFFCSIQGNRLDALQDAHSFYNWIISASSMSRLGDTLEPNSDTHAESMDDELFARLDPLAESYLPDYIVDPDLDINERTGEPHSRLLRAVRQSDDAIIWKISKSPEFEELKQEFIGHLAEGRIQSMGTGFDMSDMYSSDGSVSSISDIQGVGLTNMFFGMRTLAANFLWLKVDTFWHAGEVHRMLPLMYTCVTLDPNFVDAYLLGSWHLAYNVPAKIPETPEVLKVYSEKYNRRIGDKEAFYFEATDFLKDGIRKNPRDYRLYFDLGYAIYEQKLNDHVNAVRYLDEARRHRHDRWVPRMLYRSLMLNGQYEEAIEGWKDYLTKFENHEVAQRFLKTNTAYLHDATAEEANNCKRLALKAEQYYQEKADEARADNNTAEADHFDKEAKEAGEFAQVVVAIAEKEGTEGLKIWQALTDGNERDTRALGRLTRHRAMLLREEGRHLEAIAELDIVRWQDLQFFKEASDLIIEFKEEAGIPYTVSEQMELLRREDVKNTLEELGLEDTKPKPIYRIECKYRDLVLT